MMELIEVHHCHETVLLTNVQDFNLKALFSKIYAPQKFYVI